MSRIIILQPALPVYRLDFFERCAQLIAGDLTVYYSASNFHGLETKREAQPHWAKMLGPLHDFLPGLQWQTGALSIPIKRGDVLIVAGAPRCLSNLAVLMLARLRGAHTIWWGHYWSSTSKPWRYMLRLTLMRMSHSVVFYTDREVEECQLRMGRFAPARLSGLNNGINTDPVEACRSAYTASARKPHLLFIGRMTEKAQTRLLLMALADPRLSDIRLEIIGAGPEEASLRVQASELGIAARVVWHGPITEEATIASVANRCALFVYPGSVGLSLIHGMAYGLPAVVHSNRWHHMPEISALKPGVNGLTFEEGNAVSLAETIADALSDPIRLDRMSRESLETVRDSFNTKDMSKRFVAAVKEFTNVAA